MKEATTYGLEMKKIKSSLFVDDMIVSRTIKALSVREFNKVSDER